MGFITEMATGFPGATGQIPDCDRAAGGDAAPERLQHGRLRQVARDRGLGNQRLRSVRPLADAAGLRQVLRLPRRRDEPVGAVPLRRHHAGRAAERPELPLHDRHDGQGARLDQAPEGDDARQADVRVLRARRHPRAAPRAQGVDRPLEGQVRPGLGQDARGDAGAADRAGRGAAGHQARAQARRRSRTGTSSRPTRSACSRARPRSSRPSPSTPTTRSAACSRPSRKSGEADNTLVFYIAGDNGTSGEGGQNGMFNEITYFNGVQEKVEDMLKLIDKWGGPETYPHMAAGWAVALNAPFGWMKQVPSDFGGTRNGMVVSLAQGHQGEERDPHAVQPRDRRGAHGAGGDRPARAQGRQRRRSRSRWPAPAWSTSFDDAKAKERHTTQYFEIAGNRAIYHDGWFARTIHRAPWEAKPRRPLKDNSAWELYDVRSDFSLANDLAAKNPKKLAEMQALFLKEAAQVRRAADGRPRLRAAGRRGGRTARPDGRAHLDDARRRHDRHAGGRLHQREEPLQDHHRRDRGARERRQRHASSRRAAASAAGRSM